MLGRRGVGRGDDGGCRQARGDLPADVWSREHGDAFRGKRLGPQLAHPPPVIRGKTLGRRAEPMLRAQQRRDAFTERPNAHARRRDEQIGRLQSATEIGGDDNAVGDADPCEVPSVLPMRGQRGRLRLVTGPEDHLAAPVAGEDRRERRPPGARLEHSDTGHAFGARPSPIRGSVPWMIRARLCR